MRNRTHVQASDRPLQHTLHDALTHHCPGAPFFVPLEDRTSRQARRNAMAEILWPEVPDLIWVIVSIPLKLLFMPAVWLYLKWRAQQPQPGWNIHLETRQVQAVRQKNVALIQLEPEMGLLAHHAVIEITHPKRGPVLTLFRAASSGRTEDKSAQEDLAHLLSDRLGLRLVGCRVDLT